MFFLRMYNYKRLISKKDTQNTQKKGLKQNDKLHESLLFGSANFDSKKVILIHHTFWTQF